MSVTMDTKLLIDQIPEMAMATWCLDIIKLGSHFSELKLIVIFWHDRYQNVECRI